MGFFSRSKKPKLGSNSTSNSSSPSPATASTGGNHDASNSATTKLHSSTNPKVAGPRYTSSDEERSSSDSRAGAVHRRDSAALSTALPSSDPITEPRSKNSASNFSLEAAAASKFNPFKSRSNAAPTLKGPSSTSLNTSTSSANLARDRYAEQRGCDPPLTESPGVTTSQSTDYLSSLGHSSSRPPSIKSSRSKRASIGTGLDRWRLFSRSTNALNDMNNPEDDNRPLGSLFADENIGSDSIDKKDSSPPNTTTSLTSRWKLPIRRTSSSAGAGTDGGFVVQSIRNVSRVQDTDYENRPPLDHHRSSSTSSVTLHRSTRSIAAMSPLPAPVPDRQGSNGYGDVGMGPRPNLNIRTNSVPGASAWRDNTAEKAPSPAMISVEAFRNATRPSSRTGHRNASAISISSFEEINSPSERPRFEPTRSRRGSYQSLSSPNLDLGSAFGGFPRPAFAISGSASHSRTSTSSSMDPLPLAVSSNRPASMALQPFGPDATTSSSALRSGSTSRLSISSLTTTNEGGSLERRLSSNEDHVSAEHHAPPASQPISRPASRPSSPTVFSIPQSSSTASDAELRLIAMYGAPSPTTTEFPSISLPDKTSRTPFFLGDGPTSEEEDAGVHSGGPEQAFLKAGAHSPQTPVQNDGVRRFDEEGAAPTVAVQPPTPQVPVRRGQYQTRRASSSSAVETRSPSRLGAGSAQGRAAWGMASEKSDSEDEGDTSDKDGHRPEMSKSKAAPVSKILTSKSAPTPILQRQEVDEDDEEDDNVPLAHIRSRSSTDFTHFYSSNPDSHSSGLHMNRGPVSADVEVLAELDNMPSETLRRSPASFAMRGHSRTFSAGARMTSTFSAAIPTSTIARERTSLGHGQRSISDLSLSMLRPSPGGHTYSSPASPVPSKASIPDMNSMRASPPLPKTPISRSFHGSAPGDSPSSRSFSSNTAGISSASSLAPAPSSSWFPPMTTSAMTSDTSPAISDPGTSQSQDTLVNSISSDQDRSWLTLRERSPIIVKFKDLPVLDGERDILLAPPPIKGYRKASEGRQVNHSPAPRFVPKPLPRSSSSLGFSHETPAGSGRGLEATGATRTASRSSMIAPPSESEVLAGQTVFDRMKQRHRVEATKAIQLGKDLNGAVVQDEEDDDEDDETPLSALPSRGPSGLNSRAFEVGGPTTFAPQSSYGGFSPLTNAPPGVDQFLYATLPNDQKMQLHQRSQQMMQMMAHAALQARAESVMNGAYSDSKSAVGGVRSTAVTEKSKFFKNTGSPSPQIHAYAALPPQSPYGYMTHSQSLTNLQSYPSSPMFSAPESPASPYLYSNSLYPSSPNLTHAGYMPHHPLLPPSPQFWGRQPSPYVPQHPTPQQPMYAGSMRDYSSYASSATASTRGQAGRTSSSSMIGVPSSTTHPRGVSGGMKGVRGNSTSVIGGAGQR